MEGEDDLKAGTIQVSVVMVARRDHRSHGWRR